MTKVSLSDYRDPDVLLFSGYNRGRLVAQDILEEYGPEVELEVSSELWYISTGFRAGFREVLPGVTIPFENPRPS